MKKLIIILLCLITVMPVRSQLIGSVITAAIKAIDLQIQKLQNKTIWLQNAQKAVENTMAKLKLDEITQWVQKQQELYAQYYDELKKVRDIIAWYHRIKDITQKQLQLVAAYKSDLVALAHIYSYVLKNKSFGISLVQPFNGE